MRRTLFALAVFAAAALLLTACEQRSNVLRVANINDGIPVYADIADWYLYIHGDPAEPDSDWIAFFNDDIADVEFQYVEIGAGLPTWTPYVATINSYTIWYRSSADTTVTYDSIVVPTTVVVPADREGKRTTKAKLMLVSGSWKQQFFRSRIGDEPNDGDGFNDILQARIKFSGYDSVANRKITARANATIRVADFWDSPSSYEGGR